MAHSQNLLKTCLYSIIIFSFAQLHAQTQTSTAASTLISKSLNAFSAAAARSVQISGTATGISGSTHEAGTFTFQVQATGESTLSLNLGSLTRTETTGAFSSLRHCQWTGNDGIQHEVALQNCLLPVHWAFPVLALETQATKLNVSVSSSTDQSIPVQAVSLSVPPTDGSQSAQQVAQLSSAKLSLDATTALPTSLSFNIHPDKDENTNIPITVRYSDYRQINGASIPFHIQKYLNNSLILDLQAETAEVQ